MFAVESYAAVRHFVFVEGNSQREAEGLWREPRDDIEDFPVFSAARLHADQACGEAEVGAAAASD